MTEPLSNLNAIGRSVMRRAWPQLLMMIVFMAAISLRFPFWFVVLSTVVNGTVVAYLAQCFVSRAADPILDPLLGSVLIGSGLASVALTLKWWFVEKQQKLVPGVLLHITGHTAASSNPTLAWSAILTQWGSCSVFLVVVAVWALSCRRVE